MALIRPATGPSDAGNGTQLGDRGRATCSVRVLPHTPPTECRWSALTGALTRRYERREALQRGDMAAWLLSGYLGYGQHRVRRATALSEPRGRGPHAVRLGANWRVRPALDPVQP